jgi:hypothetical protein
MVMAKHTGEIGIKGHFLVGMQRVQQSLHASITPANHAVGLTAKTDLEFAELAAKDPSSNMLHKKATILSDSDLSYS